MECNFNRLNSYNDLPSGVSSLIEKNIDATFYGIASGRSMEGVGIFDGDLLIIDRSVGVKQGDVIFLLITVCMFVRLLILIITCCFLQAKNTHQLK